MKTFHRIATTAAAAAMLSALIIPAASACGYTPQNQFGAALLPLLIDPQNPLEQASPAALARDVRGSLSASAPSIVGMWSVQFTSKGNQSHTPPIQDGAPIDSQLTQWHNDGTEFTNSGGRSPIIQNYCMGVWVKTGQNTFVLNHYAFTYDTTGTYNGTANIAESITLSPGGTKYSGTFTITAFDTQGTKVDQVVGQLAATRITVDSTANTN